MITDFIWKTFEKTGDARYYLEYKKYRDECHGSEEQAAAGGWIKRVKEDE